jgi:hypothetical protein
MEIANGLEVLSRKSATKYRIVIRATRRAAALPVHEKASPSLRSDVMKKKGVPPRVGYVLEAQALKEARR